MRRCLDSRHHLPGCRPGRPRCHWNRKRNPKWVLCSCDCYHYPHRKGSGKCRTGLNVDAYGPDPNEPEKPWKDISL